jgi:hypothetical protein
MPARSPCPAARFRLAALLLTGAWLAAGCGDSGSAPSQGTAGRTAGNGSADGVEEIWKVSEIEGVNVGYGRTTIQPETRDGRKLLRFSQVGRLRTLRAGQAMDLIVEIDSLETPEGGLVEFQSRIVQEPGTTIRTFGRVVGDKLELRVGGPDSPPSVIPWPDDHGGLHAADLSLRREPLKPGQRRRLKSLVPAVNMVATHELVAREYETVEILGREHELLRIDVTTALPNGMSLPGTLWCDREGEIIQEFEPQLKLLSYRATKEVALGASEEARFDLVLGLSVGVDRRLDQPYETRRVRYRLTLEDGDPAEVFPSGPTQKVEPTGADTAELTVWAVRPGEPGNPDAPPDEPTEGDLQPSHLIQSDDPKIAALAEEATGDAGGPWAASLALERFVHEYVTRTDYSQAFATAADVLQNRRGDCTEHAVLLAALARARGIPARVAVGLVYTSTLSGPAFAYHMWNEVHVDGRWIPLDATLARGGADAAHLKLGHSNLEGVSAFGSFLPVAQVAGRLEIEVLEVE